MVNSIPLTEMTDLAADELHLVKTGANGFPELVAKAVADITAKSASDPEYDESTELGRRLDDLLKEVAKSTEVILCGQANCVVCGNVMAKMPFDDAFKTQLTSRARASLPTSAFVFPSKRKYPIHDLSHARNVLSRVVGKKVESTVQAAVRTRFPGIDVTKAPGVPSNATSVPAKADALPQFPTTRHDHLGGAPVRPASESPYAGDRSGSGSLYTPWNLGLAPETGAARTPTPDGGARVTQDPQPQGIGAASTTPLVAEARVVKPTNQVFPGTMNAFVTRKMAYSFSQLSDFMARIADQRANAATKEPWIEGANPAAKAPGDEPADDMDQLARNLVDCAKVVQSKDSAAIKTKLDTALALVAGLAFAEDSETDLTKAGYDLSAFSPPALSLAHDQISEILAARPFTIQSTEADDMITQEQMTQVTDAARKAATEAADAAFKTQFKGLKKTLKKLAKANGNSLGSSSNNKGEVTEGDIRGIQTQRRTADDIDVPGAQMTRTSGAGGSAPASSASAGDVTKTEGTPEGAKVEKTKKVKKDKKGDKSLKKQVKEMSGLLVKALSRPAAGGPMLTGNLPPGVAPAAQEGRQGELVTKSAEDEQIDKLQKEYEELTAKWDHTQAPSARLQEVGFRLTRMRLVKSHRDGTETFVPITAR